MAQKTSVEVILDTGRSIMVVCDTFEATHRTDGTLTGLKYTGMTRPSGILYIDLSKVSAILEHPPVGPVEVPGAD